MIGKRTSMILVAMLAASTAAAQVKTVDPNAAARIIPIFLPIIRPPLSFDAP